MQSLRAPSASEKHPTSKQWACAHWCVPPNPGTTQQFQCLIYARKTQKTNLKSCSWSLRPLRNQYELRVFHSEVNLENHASLALGYKPRRRKPVFMPGVAHLHIRILRDQRCFTSSRRAV